jgi:hypothetical protein
MAKWYQQANEVAFKAVDGGYVFQSPNPWIFARPRYYLVSEEKKAEISQVLGRWRRLFVLCVAICLPFCFAISAVLPMLFKLWPGIAGLGLPVFMPLIVLVCSTPVVVPQAYLTRRLGPLLADAPRTNERITVRHQLATAATSLSGKLLAVGLVPGLIMMAAGLLLLLDTVLEDRDGSLIPAALIILIGGAMPSAYFVYLIRLKANLRRAAGLAASAPLPVQPR